MICPVRCDLGSFCECSLNEALLEEESYSLMIEFGIMKYVDQLSDSISYNTTDGRYHIEGLELDLKQETDAWDELLRVVLVTPGAVGEMQVLNSS